MPRDPLMSRVVIASGMAETGVTMVATVMRKHAPALEVVDGGSTWAAIDRACQGGFGRMLVVTTHDIVSVSSAYALIKLVRDQYPEARIEVLVNRSEEREGLKTYGRIQAAASHFLGEMVGYAGSVPDAVGEQVREQVREQSETRTNDNAVKPPAGSAGSAAVVAVSGAAVASSQLRGDDGAVMAIQDLAIRLDEELGPTIAGRGGLRPAERRMAS